MIHFNTKWIQFFQDFLAPFYLFTKAGHSSAFTYTDNAYAPQKLIISTLIETKLVTYTFKKIRYELELSNHQINRFTIYTKNKSESYILNY